MTKSNLKNKLEILDALILPGGFFRLYKRINKNIEKENSEEPSFIEKIHPYFVASCVEIIKSTYYFILIKEAIEKISKYLG